MISSVTWRSSLATLALGLASTVVVAPANAASMFGFENIFPGDTFGDSIVGDFGFDVSDTGGGQVLFSFFTTNTVTAAVAQIAFSDSTDLLSNLTILSGAADGVQFGSTTANLPQSNNILDHPNGDAFNEDFGVANINLMGNPDGLNGTAGALQVGDSLVLEFDGVLADVAAALNSRELLVGIHVRSIDPNDESDVFVTPGTVIPEPMTIVGSTIAALGSLGLRKRRTHRS
ncbi:PEP-CTERM sorting domain-containing protein [Synechococcus sp. PCC 7336]|uniref:PEP-CTERM sorting domain-containing protein n=1 Tax=Synechococcus sp. PCC 7336 TaxID=195250 RepID=UPI000360CC5C|nr:PEP-CTERM sorting domain-containing protein [Synechococcus sp. PCC 7336]